MTDGSPWFFRRAVLTCVISLGLAFIASTGVAQTADETKRDALRTCQDPNNLPFSNAKGEGYEDEIAKLFSQELGIPLKPYFFPQRMAFIRNTLRMKVPGEDYPCDLVLSVPKGFDQVSATAPYYRSTYALVLNKTSSLASVTSLEQFLALPRDVLKKLRIGIYDRSPASEWLVKHDLVDQGVPYRILSADPEQYAGEIIDKEMVGGRIDAAIVWGPIAGYFVKKQGRALTMILLPSEKDVRFDYEIAMGVRYGEKEWKDQVESLLVRNKDRIAAILASYGVPRIDERGVALP
ncbi:MAG: quinoprotein dehydrogenase-associated putative ABC transporter substrate-binding protein [Burkholderiaceae bacterium]